MGGGSELGRLRDSGCLSLPQLGFQPLPGCTGRSGPRGGGCPRQSPDHLRVPAPQNCWGPGSRLCPASGPLPSRPHLGPRPPARPRAQHGSLRVEQAAGGNGAVATRSQPPSQPPAPADPVTASLIPTPGAQAPRSLRSVRCPGAAPQPGLQPGASPSGPGGEWQAGVLVPVSGPGAHPPAPVLAPEAPRPEACRPRQRLTVPAGRAAGCAGPGGCSCDETVTPANRLHREG